MKLLLTLMTLFLAVIPAKASTLQIDISDLAGFTGHSPVVSQTYIFQPGDTADFGTVLLYPYSQCVSGWCTQQGVSPQILAFYGPRPTQAMIGNAFNYMTSNGAIYQCPQGQGGCWNGVPWSRPLSGSGMITFVFSAQSVAIVPPVGASLYQPPAAVPLPATLWLFISGLLGLVVMQRRGA